MSAEDELRRRIEAFDGDVRLMVRTFDGREFRHQADEPSDPASVIKLTILYEAFETLDLTEIVTIPHDPKASGWGVLRRLTGDVTMSMLDVVTLMIIYSDNLATDFVLSRLDRDAMHERLRELGLEHTTAWNGFGTSFAPPDREPKNTSTARDMVTLLEHIRRHKPMMDVLSKQTDRNIIHHGTPSGVARYTKSGQSARVRNDAGILEWEGGGAYLVLFAVRNTDVPDFKVLLEYDMELAPIAEAAHLWARA
ncbi:MAG TPA: serine hydrolase [Planctomycetota bacterium]|nr:serine hydrolase [Planctomycetota bacterium]